jgi:hypothetical protein
MRATSRGSPSTQPLALSDELIVQIYEAAWRSMTWRVRH